MQRPPQLRIAFVITSLDVGGAQMMLWKLLSRIDRLRFEPFVIGLSGDLRAMVHSFDEINVPCQVLGMSARLHSARRILSLPGMLRDLSPDIVQGWMYHGNIAATMATLFSRLRVPVLWNVRGTLIDRTHDKYMTAWLIRICGWLSFSVARIINNSIASAIEHERRFGYQASKRVILTNGFDTELFRPSVAARAQVRRTLGLSPDTLLIGLIGRYHPMKDHHNFLRAANLISGKQPQVHFVLAGENVDESNKELNAMITELGLTDCVHLLGLRDDVQVIVAALDICTLTSSSGEGFPNVLGEAMSCGIPCVATDVGDSAFVVGDIGLVVPPRDSQALAAAIVQFISMDEMDRKELGARARRRIIEHFSLESVVRQYEGIYEQVHHEHAMALQP